MLLFDSERDRDKLLFVFPLKGLERETSRRRAISLEGKTMSRTERKECMNTILRTVREEGSISYPVLVARMAVLLALRKETIIEYVNLLAEAGYVKLQGTESGPVVLFTTEI